MTEAITYNNKHLFHRIILTIILLTIVFYNYFGEHVTLCEGYGWDGCSYYRNMVLNGWDEYLSGNISYYHTHRMLPFMVTHYLMKTLHITQTAPNVMIVSSIINILMLCLAVYFFFKISSILKWKKHTEIMAFTFSFFNFHVLKFMGYCPVMTDMPTFTLCWAAAYCFINNKKYSLILTGILGIVTFPLLSLIILFLTIMPKQELKNGDNRFSNIINTLIKTTYMLWLPTAFILYAIFRNIVRGAESLKDIFIARYPQNIYITIAGLIFYIVFYYFATQSLRKDWKEFFNALSKPTRIITIIISLIIFFILYKLPTAYGFEGSFSLVNELAQICQFPATDILIFVETHFFYLGIVFILFILCWPNICNIGCQWGSGYFLTLMSALFFLPDIETRKLICFFIFTLLPLMNYINDIPRIRKEYVYLTVVIQLGLSFFWFTINVPGIEEAFNTYSVDTYLQWPSQRYYMFQGPWQSHSVYFITLIIETIITIAIWLCWKRKILFVDNNGEK